MKIERIEPTQLPNGLWLDGNEYASENVEESSGVLSLVTGETEGYRVGPELDVGAISDVTSSKLEWTSSGDAEVLAAVSEVSAQGSMKGDGVDDWVQLPELNNFGSSLNNTVTSVSFWAKFTDDSNERSIFGTNNGRHLTAFEFRHNRGGVYGRFLLVLRGEDDSTISSSFNASITPDQWYFLKLTYDLANSNVYFNIDGALVHTFEDLSFDNAMADFASPLAIFANYSTSQGLPVDHSDITLYDFKIEQNNVIIRLPLDDPPGSATARDISGNNNDGTIYGASYSHKNPLLQQATNGQAIPGVTPGADLTGKKLYTQQRFSRATTGDPSPTLTSLTAEISSPVSGVPYQILTYGGWI